MKMKEKILTILNYEYTLESGIDVALERFAKRIKEGTY